MLHTWTIRGFTMLIYINIDSNNNVTPTAVLEGPQAWELAVSNWQ